MTCCVIMENLPAGRLGDSAGADEKDCIWKAVQRSNDRRNGEQQDAESHDTEV